jgi:D-alanyl-D-alanine carboxypeptidase
MEGPVVINITARYLSFLLLPVLLAGCGSHHPTVDTVQLRIQEMVSAKYSAYKAANNLPDNAGVVVHLVTPTGTWTATAGLPAGADQHWHYRIASVSKTFTAASILLLDQQGKLRIDDRLTDPIPGTDVPYLPASPNYEIPNKSQITIRQLLSHRAGVYDVYNTPIQQAPYNGYMYGDYIKYVLDEPDHQFTIDELAGVISANNLSFFAPGADYHYSDTGYSLLAKIIERVSGTSYDRFIADNLLAPVGLKQTIAPWSAYDTSLPAPYLHGYASLDSSSGFDDTTEYNMSDQVGPGNIISTPADMGRWIRTLLSGRGPLTREQLTRMTTVPAGNTSYALGIGNSALGMGHAGAHPGYVNLVAYHPVDDVAVVVATPFIDYSKLEEHLAFITDLGKEARRIAGYTTPWPLQ